jgi:endonuclease-3 related protein
MLKKIYEILLQEYGPQGWWPLLDYRGTNPTKTGAVEGYHPAEYDFPKTDQQIFEICVGAILTQNTSWAQVEKALKNLAHETIITPTGLKKLEENVLKDAIKPAGYFNQKAKKLLLFIDFYASLHRRTPSRKELLSVWGIGKETADSILLYAYGLPIFVVDAYTRRIFSMLGFVDKDAEYDVIQNFVMNNLPQDIIVYQEFHALIVEHAKRHCKTKPDCQKCILKKHCQL